MCVTFFVGAVARYPNEIGRAKVGCFDLGALPFSRFFLDAKFRPFEISQPLTYFGIFSPLSIALCSRNFQTVKLSLDFVAI